MGLRLFFIVIAVLMIVLIPIAPKMIGLRIAVYRKLQWNGLANFHEKHFDGLVIVARIIMALIFLVLMFLVIRV